jgi:RNA polymerase sigma factor (sigma-70 family)
MAEAPSTRASLLVRIRDCDDQAAWSQFVDLYAPLIYRFARGHGLQDADAADLAQDVLQAVAKSARGLEYDPKRGTFRGWLYTVTRNKLRNFLAKRGREAQGTGDTSQQLLLNQHPERDDEDSALWDREYEHQLFAWAAEQVRGEVQESTWRAFWLTAVEGRSGKDVSEQLGISIAATYLAKSRVMARLKELIRDAVADQDSPGAQWNQPNPTNLGEA